MKEKTNPNLFRVGDEVILDECCSNKCEVVIHEMTETQRLVIIGRPGAPKEEWYIVQMKRLSPKPKQYGNN
jgi:hypothetical protein